MTLEIAQTELTRWTEASQALATAQSYEIDSGGVKRKLTRVDLDKVFKAINYWQSIVDRLTRNGNLAPSVKYVVPREL